MNEENLEMGADAYTSHGSGIAIPALLERLFFAGEHIREGCRLSTIGTPHIEPFINARAVLYIEVFGILRSSITKDDRETLETEFEQIHDLIMEIMASPDKRRLNKIDTLTLYNTVGTRITKLWFVINDFLQGKKQFYVRAAPAKDDLFLKELDVLKKQLKGSGGT